MQLHDIQKTQVTSRRSRESKETDLYDRKCSLHEKTVSLGTLHLKKVR